MTDRRQLVVATRNAGKRRELETILACTEYEVLSLEAFPNVAEIIEDGETFWENAQKKARQVSKQTGLLTLGEDSGLEVGALGGKPGIRSARFARGVDSSSEENIARLLREMRDVSLEKRNARFVCYAVLYDDEEEVGKAFGEVHGLITTEPRGKHGFGYDPVFLLREYGKTFGELPESVKNQISHRAVALRKVKEILTRLP